MARLEPFFLKSHGKPRFVDRRVLSGIKNGKSCSRIEIMFGQLKD